MAFGLGSAGIYWRSLGICFTDRLLYYLFISESVGPLIAGEVYDHAPNGWTVMLAYGCGLLLICIILNFTFMGEKPLLTRVSRKVRERDTEESVKTSVTQQNEKVDYK